MNCPYCQKELIKGYIYGDRYALKWLPAEKKLFLGLAIGSEVLPNDEKSLRPRVEAFKCHECKKMVIDLDE